MLIKFRNKKNRYRNECGRNSLELELLEIVPLSKRRLNLIIQMLYGFPSEWAWKHDKLELTFIPPLYK